MFYYEKLAEQKKLFDVLTNLIFVARKGAYHHNMLHLDCHKDERLCRVWPKYLKDPIGR
jgi:hypothetical protein